VSLISANGVSFVPDVDSPEVRPPGVRVKTTTFINSKWNWPNYGEDDNTCKNEYYVQNDFAKNSFAIRFEQTMV
jgi:hypothetical protein